jgi:2-haloacid dehalogenase
MAYKLFLFDVDDTLLDFKATEKHCISEIFKHFGVVDKDHQIFSTYQKESQELWKQLELNQISKEFLKAERFRRTFSEHQIDVDPHAASDLYLEQLQETVILVEHAREILAELAQSAEIGIVTNGIESVQQQRLKKSQLDQYISFTVVSEACGYAKPDIRFFEHMAKIAKNFSKESALVVGDRLETDVLGAHNFGLDACWFNPLQARPHFDIQPKHQVRHLSEISGLQRS